MRKLTRWLPVLSPACCWRQAHDGGAEQGLFSEGMVMAWFVQLLLGLHHLHRRRILHRDLKPDNVLLSANKRVASLADLGTSKALAGHGALAATCAGAAGGMGASTTGACTASNTRWLLPAASPAAAVSDTATCCCRCCCVALLCGLPLQERHSLLRPRSSRADLTRTPPTSGPWVCCCTR